VRKAHKVCKVYRAFQESRVPLEKKAKKAKKVQKETKAYLVQWDLRVKLVRMAFKDGRLSINHKYIIKR